MLASLGGDLYLAFLNAAFQAPSSADRFVGIYLSLVSAARQNYVRVGERRDVEGFMCEASDRWEGSYSAISSVKLSLTKIFVRHRGQRKEHSPTTIYGFDVTYSPGYI